MNHRANAVLSGGALVVAVIVFLSIPPRKATPVPEPLEAPVPMQEWTTADAGTLLPLMAGHLPPPGPNQLRAGKCDKDMSQEEINGGCWVATTKKPPCPTGKQWEHNGMCWLPVAPAKPTPTTGEPRPRGVATP